MEIPTRLKCKNIILFDLTGNFMYSGLNLVYIYQTTTRLSFMQAIFSELFLVICRRLCVVCVYKGSEYRDCPASCLLSIQHVRHDLIALFLLLFINIPFFAQFTSSGDMYETAHWAVLSGQFVLELQPFLSDWTNVTDNFTQFSDYLSRKTSVKSWVNSFFWLCFQNEV